jgi:4-amino-4-deoxy-L-arabinose transferase-like glycosyltransferase
LYGGQVGVGGYFMRVPRALPVGSIERVAGIVKQGARFSIPDSLRAISKPSVGLVAILALTFYLRLLYFGQIIDCDVGRAGYVGWRMAEGEVLIDLEGPGKPPLYVMLYAVFIRLFGTSVLGLKMFGAVFVLLAVLAIYGLANRVYGKQVGLLAALLFGFFSSGPMIEGGTVNLETVLHFFYVLAIGFFLKASISGRLRWYFLTGLCAAVATLVKQVGGVLFFVFLGYGLHEWWRKKGPFSIRGWLYRYILLGVGALLPVISVITFYDFHGYTLYQLYDSMLGSNLRYVQRGYEYTSFLKNFVWKLKVILPENGILWLGTMYAAAYLLWRIRQNKEQPSDRILLWWALWSFAALWATGTFFWHYFLQVIAPFSVLASYGIMATWKWAKSLSSLQRFVAQGVWAMILVIMGFIFVKTDYKYFFSYTPVEQTVFRHEISTGIYDGWGLYDALQPEIASYIREHTDPTETVYVWGIAPQIYFLAQRKAATRYWTHANMSMFVTNNSLKAFQAHAPMVMEDIRKSQPAYIVQIFRLEDFPELQDFVRDQYIIDKNLEFFTPPYKIHLYRRHP